MLCCRQRNASTAYLNCMMNPSKTKGSNNALEAGFCCFCQRHEETYFGQRQQYCLSKQDFAASAEDPMKSARTKGNNIVSQARFCCLCQRPEETRQDQRQQSHLASKILLLLPKTQRNAPRSKAANTPRKQDFAASAEDPMKLTRIKGSNTVSQTSFCCFRLELDDSVFHALIYSSIYPI